MPIDVVLVNPSDRARTYGPLAIDLAAVEPPLWIALLAAYLREQGFSVSIMDADAEGWGPGETARRVILQAPLLCGVGAVGANPSASSTPKMTAVRAVLKALAAQGNTSRTLTFGIHPSGLPQQTMAEEKVDFLCQGETFGAVTDLMNALKSGGDCRHLPGIWARDGATVIDNGWAKQLDDIDVIPMAAWDLLPMAKYRAHNWHCFGHLEDRASYAIMYTSLGCPYHCSYCNIHALYGGRSGIRFRSVEKVFGEIDLLVNKYGVRNFKFLDELFAVHPKRMEEICTGLVDRRYKINIWAYARIDTVSDPMLKLLARAGVNWLAYGIEAANNAVRQGVSKGRFDQARIREVVRMTRDNGINIIGNYMFGLPDDDMSTMQETFDLARELNCEYANFYTTMAYPGSKLYDETVKAGVALPPDWSGFSQYSRNCVPLPTRHLTSAQVLAFRDNAFHEYYASPAYQDMILRKFGSGTLTHVQAMARHRLTRNIPAPS